MNFSSSKIILGTVQFGTKYGLKKNKKILEKKKIFKIFDYAYQNGVRFFDTAKNYKTEKLIGEFVKVNGITDLKLIAKFPYGSNKYNLYNNYSNAIEETLENTHLESIEAFLVHDLNDLKILSNSSTCRHLGILQKKYPIKNIGVSIYNRADFRKSNLICKNLIFQFPYNVLNKEFDKIYSNKLVYVRSIFLQGFLINKSVKFKNNNIDLLHKKYHGFLDSFNIDPFDFAVNEILKKNFKYYVIGIDNLNELKKIINYKVKNFYDISFKHKYDKKLIDPRLW